MEPIEEIVDPSPNYVEPQQFFARRSFPEPPPGYSEEENDEKRAVEVCLAPPNAIFEPAERQRHFGILRYTMNNRFNKMMLIGGLIVILIIILIVSVVLLIVFTVSKGNSTFVLLTTTITKPVSLPTPKATEPFSTRTTPVHYPSTELSTATKTIPGSSTTNLPTTKIIPLQTTKTTLSNSTNATKSTSYPTTEPSTATTTKFSDDSCSPFTNTTFLFSYSNDFPTSTVLDSLSWLTPNGLIPTHYSMVVSNRFDIVDQDDFSYHTNFSSFNESVYNHLPDPSLGYPSISTGSDVLKMIDRFLSSDQFPVCGSNVLVLVKRYPSNIVINELVSKLRKFHSTVTFIVSGDRSGGLYSGALYNLSSRTNGFCAFVDHDADVPEGVLQSSPFLHPFLIYAVNPKVYETGLTQLPPLSLPVSDLEYRFIMTIQNNGQMNVVNNALMSLASAESTINIGLAENRYYGSHNGNYVCAWPNLHQSYYNVYLNFDYSDEESRTLQIRVRQDVSTLNNWLPYDN